MRIKSWCVTIGGRREYLSGMDIRHPDVAVLLEAGEIMRSSVDITLPATKEVAAALGRLLFAKADAEEELEGELEIAKVSELELIKNLSLSLEKLAETNNCWTQLARQLEFVWQVAEKTDDELLAYKGFGPVRLKEAKRVLAVLGLSTGMNLVMIKHRLPSAVE